jgi:hypothetical protein
MKAHRCIGQREGELDIHEHAARVAGLGRIYFGRRQTFATDFTDLKMFDTCFVGRCFLIDLRFCFTYTPTE